MTMNNSNLAFVYMPFILWKGKAGEFCKIEPPDSAHLEHWKEVQEGDDDTLEKLYLYSHVVGVKAGEETSIHIPQSEQKCRHFVFSGGLGDSSPAECAFADAFQSLAASSTPTGVTKARGTSDEMKLFDLTRELAGDGPLCDKGSSYLVDKGLGKPSTLGSLLYHDWDNENACTEGLSEFSLWRICKAHRFPDFDKIPREGEHADESREQRYPFVFDIQRVHCYLFHTGIAILVFELSFLVPSAARDIVSLWASAGMFHLKKVQNVRICPVKRTGDLLDRTYQDSELDASDRPKDCPEGISFCNLGKLLASDFLMDSGASSIWNREQGRPYLFLHVPGKAYKDSKDAMQQTLGKSMRANALVYVCEPQSTTDDVSVGQKLFYLSHCLDCNVPYSSRNNLPVQRIVNGPDIQWAITAENASCLAWPLPPQHGISKAWQDDAYVTSALYGHIRHQYQYLYVLLLHQKYFYYTLMSETGKAKLDDLETFVKLREDLEYFNVAFDFCRVTEIVQYQQFYDTAKEAMGIDALKSDVHANLEWLASEQRRRDKRKEEERENRLNIMGFAIAFVGAGSLIIDLATYIAGGVTDWCVFICCLLGVAGVIALVFLFLRTRGRKS